MSVSDVELLWFVAPWIGLGFGVAFILGLLLEVQGAIGAFALGGIAPALVCLPPSEMPSLVDAVLGMFRAPIPFALYGAGSIIFAELAMDWWMGAIFGAALAIYLRRWRPA